MTNYDLKQTALLWWQFLLSLSFIVSIVISLTLTYNEILKRSKRKPLYNSSEETAVLKFNRSLAALISLGFLIINIDDKKVRQTFNTCNEKIMNMQISASTFNLIATLIVLYIAFTADNNNIENPEL